MSPPLRFAVVGVDHFHVFALTDGLMAAGADCGWWYGAGGDLGGRFARTYSTVPRATSIDDVLADPSIRLIVCAGIPDTRVPLALTAMAKGKDVLADKPGAVTVDQVDAIELAAAQTGRRFLVLFNERFDNPAMVAALATIRAGRIGEVVNIVGLGPHTAYASTRPPWFFAPERFGGILVDIASHQIDEFLAFTSSAGAEVVAARTANVAHPDHPQFDDFGELLLRAGNASGYARVDYLNPPGLPTWADQRLIVTGTRGYVEVRSTIDIAGAGVGPHLFVVDQEGVERVDLTDVRPTWAGDVVADLADGGNRFMTQAHCLAVCRTALTAQAMANRSRAGVIASGHG